MIIVEMWKLRTLTTSLLYRSTRFRCHEVSAINDYVHGFRNYTNITSSSSSRLPHRICFTFPPHATPPPPPANRDSVVGCLPPFPFGVSNIHSLSEDVAPLPFIRDPDIHNVFEDVMAISWDDLPDAVISAATKVLSKNTMDIAGQEALANVLRAAEAVEEFGGILVNLRMEIDDIIGMSGEKIGPLPDEHAYALDEVHKRLEEYLDSFGSDEEYLQKKVETELGPKMTLLKMRCSFLEANWRKNGE